MSVCSSLLLAHHLLQVSPSNFCQARQIRQEECQNYLGTGTFLASAVPAFLPMCRRHEFHLAGNVAFVHEHNMQTLLHHRNVGFLAIQLRHAATAEDQANANGTQLARKPQKLGDFLAKYYNQAGGHNLVATRLGRAAV